MAAPGQSQASFPLEDTRTQRASILERGRVPASQPAEFLWLCLKFPALPVEVLWTLDADRKSVAVVEEENAQQRVMAANAHAQERGVTGGISLNAAYALASDLEVLPRDTIKEARMLERLAVWCAQFTPQISLEPPDSLLLEVQGSLHLFGGTKGLIERIETGLARLGHRPRWAFAPTPRASLWLTRAGGGQTVTDPARLADRLGELPLSCTGWPVALRTKLDGMGVNNLRGCMRLPRDGFVRRFGRTCRDDLDRALGALHDPRDAFPLPERFEAGLELPAETDDLALIERGAARLIDELDGYLSARQAGVQEITLEFFYCDLPASHLVLGLTSLSRDPKRMTDLLHERLQRYELAAPVIALHLKSARSYPLAGRDRDLFAAATGDGRDWPELVERLRARLGVEAVTGLCLVPEHRPEAAWRRVEPGLAADAASAALRPLWMLSEPRRMPIRDGRPRWDGPLTFLQGPERIETGWWDGHDVMRDYYVVATSLGLRLWIYRERRARGAWFLHGVFA